ncbi:hypothetical protein [Haloplanus halophilus]|uniref:hypothetical protein n=1 Tax=Haloplanus halophilus TaxID=2949993 RepID=UPI002041C43B|nr:hypothetical protein [Haloplanus sp. GDY1]
MDDDGLAVTRRRALGAVAAGAASVGVSVGTDAFLADDESFDGTRIAAGEFDLEVAWHAVVESATTRVRTSEGWPTLRSDAAAPVCDLSGLTPGDGGRLTLALRIGGDSGYLSLLGRERTDAENGQSEPETGALRESIPAHREGELDELTTVRVSYLDPDDPTDPAATGTTTPVWTASLASLVGLGGLGDGVPLDGGETASAADLLVADAARGAYPAGETRYLRLDWTVPTWVGAGVASDGFACTFGLYGEERR